MTGTTQDGRAKSTSSGASTGPRTPKRVVASRACDSCRTRRIRCLQPGNTNDKSKPCKACGEASLRCTYDLLNKRRGPPAKWRSSAVQNLSQKRACNLAQELELFCSTPVVEYLIQNFVDHLYPLAPAIHIPSFFADYQKNRQAHDLKFFTLLISILLVTICTLSGEYDRCKELDPALRFASCQEMLEAGEWLIRQLIPADYYDNHSLEQWACHFLLMLANGEQLLMQRASMHHAQATTILRQLNLHRIIGYQGLNNIQQQLGKKALWMNFTTVSHLKLHYMQSEYGLTELAHLGNDAGALLPLEVDDHLITKDEVFPQPANRLSVVAGLNALTAINKTWMDSAITTPHPPVRCHYNDVAADSGERLGTCECGREVHLAGPLVVARERLRRLESCLDDIPPELALEPPSNTWKKQPPISAVLQSQYDLLRANVQVTHLWAQNHLLELIVALSAERMHGSELMQVREQCFESQKIIARKLLRFLNTLPRFDLFPNGLVLIIKVRSVGASLLQERPPSLAATDKEMDDLVRSFAKLLAELDAEHGALDNAWKVSSTENFAY